MNRLDEQLSEAFSAVRDSAGSLPARRWTAPSGYGRGLRAAFAAAAIVIIAVGLPALLRSEPEPSSLGQTPSGPRIIELLDGTRLRTNLDLDAWSYSFWYSGQGLDGERNVSVSHSTPERAASRESAAVETAVSSRTSLWEAVREGSPVFITVQSGEWVSFMHLGQAGDEWPATQLGALEWDLSLASSPTGASLIDYPISQFSVHVTKGPDFLKTVTVAVGRCLREEVQGSAVIEHEKRGSVVRADGYASWCHEADNLEIEVSGDEEWVAQVLDTVNFEIVQPPSVDITDIALTTDFEFHMQVVECVETATGLDFGELSEHELFPGYPSDRSRDVIRAARLHDSEIYMLCYQEATPEPPVLEPVTGYRDFSSFEHWEVDWFEVTRLVVECANDHGIPLYVSPTGDGAFGMTDAGQHNLSVAQAVFDACQEGLMLPEYAEAPREWIEDLYDYWLEVKACMEERDWPVSDPPTKEEFLAAYPDGGWHPYDLIPDAGVPTFSAVETACPQTPR